MSDEQFKQLMVAITELDSGMHELKSDMKEVKSDVKEVKKRVTKVEEGMEYLIEKVGEHDQAIFHLKKAVK